MGKTLRLWYEMMKYYGLAEVPGPINNPVIVGWFHELGFDINNDETAWCSCVLNIMAKKAGLEYTGKLDARSWLKVGTPVEIPEIGDVVVFYRGKVGGWQGHVGIFAGYNNTKSHVFTLGGNQGNTISIAAYPVASPAFGILGFTRLNAKI